MSITYTLQCLEDKLVLTRRKKKKIIFLLLQLLQKLVGVGELGELSFKQVHFSDITRVSHWAPETSRLVLSLSVYCQLTLRHHNSITNLKVVEHLHIIMVNIILIQAHREMNNSVLSPGLEKDVRR